MKRFQESSRWIKMIRYRWYLMRPFWFLKFLLSKNGSELGSTFSLRCSNIWKITTGIAQSRMHWYWTEEEVWDHFNKKFKG